jgi:hypothetical protein
MISRVIVILLFLVTGCSKYNVKVDNDKILFTLRNDSKPYFHYSVDGFMPHEMKEEDGVYYFSIKKSKDFKYFFTEEKGLIKVDCPFIEYDDFGGYSCIFAM